MARELFYSRCLQPKLSNLHENQTNIHFIPFQGTDRCVKMNIVTNVKAVVILQIDGKRLVTKYYDEDLRTNSKNFERKLFEKTKSPKSKEDIRVLDEYLVVHKYVSDMHIYVVGGRNENPMIINTFLENIVKIVDAVQAQDGESGRNGGVNLDIIKHVILALDEMCDSGIILENNPDPVIDRITSTNINEPDFESLAQRTLAWAFSKQ